MNVATLADPAAVDAWIAAPGARWILKHSNACPVSAAGRMEFEEYLASRAGETAAMLVVQTHRPASNRVAERLGVRHETPQAFLLRDGKVLWHASHGGITAAAMEAARKAAG